MKHFILHYGEIALKKGNRSFFENTLQKRVVAQLNKIGPLNVRKLSGRLWLEFAAPPDQKMVADELKKIFGLVNFIPCGRSEVSLESLKQHLDLQLKEKNFSSFAVRAKRGEQNFPLGSQYVNEEIGRFVQEKTGAKVNLDDPETTIHIEMFKDHIFYGFEKIACFGGLPVGIAGKVAGLL